MPNLISKYTRALSDSDLWGGKDGGEVVGKWRMILTVCLVSDSHIPLSSLMDNTVKLVPAEVIFFNSVAYFLRNPT